MKQVIYVTNRLQGGAIGGREQLSKLHARILLELLADEFECIELDRSAGISKLFGYLDGVNRSSIDLVCSRILASGAQQVFLDGSNLGRLAQGIRTACPGVEIITFFHNCEARFFLGAFRRSRSPKALAVLLANYLAERSAVRFSDKRICLNERDSALLQRLYGRCATHLSGMAISDKLTADAFSPIAPPTEKYALFVGGAFYANQAGIAWFCENVAPHVSLKTCVVGKGMQAVKDELEKHGNVTVLGEIQDLGPWYRNAQVVVAPIFDGSGMKTKVAEALMFGKRMLGTPEAFTGYEAHLSEAGKVCRTAGDFIAAIEEEMIQSEAAPSARLRRIYEDHYSPEAAKQRILSIINDRAAAAPVLHS